MADQLIVVEYKEEVEYLLQNHPELFKGHVKVISLLPESSVVLEASNIAFETSVNYFSKNSHEDCLQQVDLIIRQINEGLTLHDGNHLKKIYMNALTFYLRLYLSYVFWVMELLNNIIQSGSATRLHICRYQDNDFSGYVLSSKERILGELAEAFKDQIEVCYYSLKIPASARPDRRKKILKKLICSVLFPLEMMRMGKLRKHPMVFYSLKYYFDHIARSFKGNDLFNVAPNKKSYTRLVDSGAGVQLNNVHLDDAFGFRDHEFQASLRKAMTDLKSLNATRQLFSFRGFDFSSILFRKCDLGFGPELEKLNRQIGALKKFYARLNPAVVLSHVARDFSYAMGELAELMGIPSILISHGSHVVPKNEYDRMEWYDHGKGLVHTDYRYHLLQSPWAVEHVRAMGYQGNYFAIKPLIFPTVDRTGKNEFQLKMFPQSQGKKVFVHAGTPKQRGFNRFYIYETLDEYIAYMCDLVEAARHMPEIFLIIRFRPFSCLSTSQLKQLLPSGDHYVVATEGTFADYLRIADVLVSFSSTTIEEALINRIPVLQYDPSDRYMHLPGACWQDKAFAHADSVYYIGDRKNLMPAMQWILENHLNSTLVGDLFERHVFQSGEAVSVEEFIKALIDKNLPEPIQLKVKKHLDGVEIF
jgi:hypothetical protein